MKKNITILLAAISVIFSAVEVKAQNVQLHYDMGRNCATSTVEMFRADEAAVMGKSKEYQRMGESESKSWNRSGTFMQLCKQGISCNAYCGCEMDILN